MKTREAEADPLQQKMDRRDKTIFWNSIARGRKDQRSLGEVRGSLCPKMTNVQIRRILINYSWVL